MHAPHRRPSLAGAAAVLGAALLLLTFPAISRAGCGGVETARAHHHVNGQRAPLAIGDSTMLLSLPGLAGEGYDVSAHGCRQFSEALMLLRTLRAQGALPHMVTIALGANGTVSTADIDAALEILCCNRLLVLITPRESGGGAGADAATERQAASAHPGRVLVLDWVRFSRGRSSWFQPDGLHLTFPGVDAFTHLLGRALPYGYAPCPTSGGSRRARKARRVRARARRVRHDATATAPLAIRAVLTKPAYVGAEVTGPPGAAVALGEQVGGSVTTVNQVTLPASGTLTVQRLLTWLCTRRVRTVVATSSSAGSPMSASSTVHTPTCSRRLITTVSAHARVGRDIAVRVRDRWRLGGVGVNVCLAAPGATATCSAAQIPPGSTEQVLPLTAPRPGYWQVTVRTGFQRLTRATVRVTHPDGHIRLLAAGDSQMQILDGFLSQDLASHSVRGTSDARVSTGLTNSFIFDWQSEARRLARSLHPDVTVIFMGANDGFTVLGPGGKPVQCCTVAWSVGYADLAARMMSTLLEGSAGRVYWFLLPAPRPGNFRRLFNAVNAGIRDAARRFPGRVGLINANAFFTPHNRYRDYMSYHGHGFVIHEPDGIHLSTASDTLAAQLVTRQLRNDRVIR